MSRARQKKGEGPLAAYFDFLRKDAKLDRRRLKRPKVNCKVALDTAKRKLGVSYEDIDVLFAGDLLNQCISSSFAPRGTVDSVSGTLRCVLDHGGVTSSGSCVCRRGFARIRRRRRLVALRLGRPAVPLPARLRRTAHADGPMDRDRRRLLHWEKAAEEPRIEPRPSEKFGITASGRQQHGRAMAPAAIDHNAGTFRDLRRVPSDYDLIVTRATSAHARQDDCANQFRRIGVDLSSVYNGLRTSHLRHEKAGRAYEKAAPAAGAEDSVLCGYLLDKLEKQELPAARTAQRARCSPPTSSWQGESIPACVTQVAITAEGGSDGLSESISRRSDSHARADSGSTKQGLRLRGFGVLWYWASS